MIKRGISMINQFNNQPNYLIILLIMNLMMDSILKIILINMRNSSISSENESIITYLASASLFYLIILLIYIMIMYFYHKKLMFPMKINEFLHVFLSMFLMVFYIEISVFPLEKPQNLLDIVKCLYIMITFFNKLQFMLSRYFIGIFLMIYLIFRVCDESFMLINSLFLIGFLMIWSFYLILTSNSLIYHRKLRFSSNFSFKQEKNSKISNNSNDFVLNSKICKILFGKLSECVMVLDFNLANLYQNKAFINEFNFASSKTQPLNFKALVKKIKTTGPISSHFFQDIEKKSQNYVKNPKNLEISKNFERKQSIFSYLNKIVSVDEFVAFLMKDAKFDSSFTASSLYSKNNDLTLLKIVTFSPIPSNSSSNPSQNPSIKLLHFAGKTSNIAVLLYKPFPTSDSDLGKTIENQNKMLSFVSHEFRTPLNCINAMLQSLEDAIPEGIYQQFIEPALSSGKYLMNMIQDILDISQIKAGKFKLLQIEFDLNLLLNDVFQLFQVQTKTKKIDLVFEIEKRVPKVICTDPNRLKQVLINLMSNAFKYTQNGEIRLKCEVFEDLVKKEGKIENIKNIKNIENNVKNSHNILRISIIDTGLGVKFQDKDKLLHAFGRIDDPKNLLLNPQGVGLGLIISQDISKALSSDLQLSESQKGLQFESEYGKGSNFFFIFENKKKDYLPEDFEQECDSPEFNNLEIQKKNEENHLKFLEKKQDVPKEDQTPFFPPFKDSNSSVNLPKNLTRNTSVNFSNLSRKTFPKIHQNTSGNDVIYVTKDLENSPNRNSKNSSFSLSESRIFRNFSQITIKPMNSDRKSLQKRASFYSDLSISFTSNSGSNKSKLEEMIAKVDNFPVYAAQKKCICPDILICDDDSYNILALQFLLDSLSIYLDISLSGQEAIDKVKDLFDYNRNSMKNSNEKLQKKTEKCCKFYKLVFLDIEMPVKDGLETCKELKTYLKGIKALEETKIIACTGYNDVDMNLKIKEAGFDHQLVKPILKGALMGILIEFLNEKRKKK